MMVKTFMKVFTTFLLVILSIGLIFAAQKASFVEKTYFLRIISINPKKEAIPFTGAYVVTGKDHYRVIKFLFSDKPGERLKTPYEETIKGTALSTMIVATDSPKDDNIKVEIYEKEGVKITPIMSGTGLTIVSTNDANLVFNNIYAK